MPPWDLQLIKLVPIIDVAKRLKIDVRGKKAMCFTKHDDRTPSLSFSTARNTWKCFGACNKWGDGLKLVQEVTGCDFKAAILWFEIEFGISSNLPSAGRRSSRRSCHPPVPKPASNIRPKEFAEDPELYEWLLSKCGPVTAPLGTEYLNDHGIPLESANQFGVRELRDPLRAFSGLVDQWGKSRVFRSGLAWGDNQKPERLIWTSYAILFPLCSNARVTCLQGRLFKGDRKFLLPRGANKSLFNSDLLKSLSVGSRVHLCEGIPDAIALASLGLNSIGVLGASSFRAEWAQMFTSFIVDVMVDADAGGDTFLKGISTIFHECGMTVRPVRMPKGKKDVASVAESLRSAR